MPVLLRKQFVLITSFIPAIELYFGNILILDIRERPRFQQSHIASSINLHLSSCGEVVAVNPSENHCLQSSHAFQNRFAFVAHIAFWSYLAFFFSSYVVIVSDAEDKNDSVNNTEHQTHTNYTTANAIQQLHHPNQLTRNTISSSSSRHNVKRQHCSAYMQEKTLQFVQMKSKLTSTQLRPEVMFLEGA